MDKVLPDALQQVAMHIFFRKVPVQLSNRRELDALPGELLAFEASFENDCSKSMYWPRATVLHLTHGCKVMLVWNKSHDLKNGSLGIFTGEKGDVLLVAFDGVGIVEISRETWIKRNRNGNKIEVLPNFQLFWPMQSRAINRKVWQLRWQWCIVRENTYLASFISQCQESSPLHVSRFWILIHRNCWSHSKMQSKCAPPTIHGPPLQIGHVAAKRASATITCYESQITVMNAQKKDG